MYPVGPLPARPLQTPTVVAAMPAEPSRMQRTSDQHLAKLQTMDFLKAPDPPQETIPASRDKSRRMSGAAAHGSCRNGSTEGASGWPVFHVQTCPPSANS